MSPAFTQHECSYHLSYCIKQNFELFPELNEHNLVFSFTFKVVTLVVLQFTDDSVQETTQVSPIQIRQIGALDSDTWYMWDGGRGEGETAQITEASRRQGMPRRLRKLVLHV